MDWEAALAVGRYDGSAVDVADGYIHFSAADQAPATAAKYFTGQDDLLVLILESEALGAAIKWEPSRGGALFPHLYASLDCGLVIATRAAPLGADGVPQLGDLGG